MDLNTLYSYQRTGNHPVSKTSRTDFQRDFDRIVFSSAFRRLQNKTQVFPLPGSVFVHNRLTHSLEVSSVGRSLGMLAGEFICDAFGDELTEDSKQFYKYELSNVITAGCLCHDIGNPAFGHSGEDAIARYFIKNENKLKSNFTDAQWADFINFEGNANAIRVLTHQQNGKDAGGLQLTFSTLASIAKYPCESVAKNNKILHRKKFGFFQSEKSVFQQFANQLGMLVESEKPLSYKRHLFVWLVEAADDICYNIIDMEDAHRLGLVTTKEVEQLFLDLILYDAKNANVPAKLKMLNNANERISYLRAKTINVLIEQSIAIFKQEIKSILKGDLQNSLIDLFKKEQKSLKQIESFSIEKIYSHRSVIEIENAGYNVMYELLEHFITPCLVSNENKTRYDKKVMSLLPLQFQYDETGAYQKTLGVLDFISGMTDDFANELYRKIKGIEIGMTQ